MYGGNVVGDVGGHEGMKFVGHASIFFDRGDSVDGSGHGVGGLESGEGTLEDNAFGSAGSDFLFLLFFFLHI